MSIHDRKGFANRSYFFFVFLIVLIQTSTGVGAQTDYYAHVRPGPDLRQQLQDLGEETHIHSLDYKVARKAVIGYLHALPSTDGKYYVRDVYCQTNSPTDGPKGIADGLNVEHTWPQSHFFQSPDRFRMKSDLHHLFPSKPLINSQRGNMKFGVINGDRKPLSCQASKLGLGEDGEPRFEPPKVHQGNVARALFYFAVRYGGMIDADEEAVLREWHREDPVDAPEMRRNDEIELLQGNRNPFIDHPEFVDQIQDF